MNFYDNILLNNIFRGLSFYGLSKNPKSPRGFRIMKMVLTLSLYLILMILQVLEFLRNLTNLKELTFIGCTMIWFMICFTKLQILWCKHSQYFINDICEKTNIKNCIDDQEIRILEDGVAYAKRVNLIQILWYAFTTALSAIPPMIFPVVREKSKFLSLAIWLPWNIEKHFFYSCMIVNVTAFPSACLAVLLEVLVLNLIMHPIIQLRILQNRIKTTFNEKFIKRKIVSRKFSECVKFHNEIIKYVENLSRVLSPLLLAQFLLYTMMFCATAFQLLLTIKNSVISSEYNSKLIMLITYMPITAFELFITYWHGAMLHQEGLNVGMTAFGSKWYFTNETSIRNNLLILIQRSQKSLTIKVGPLFTLTMETYLIIMKTAYTLLTFLVNYK